MAHRVQATHEEPLMLGPHLRKLRLSAGWTLERLAKLIGLSRSGLCQIERGKVEPSLSTLRRLAKALNVPLARLFESSPSGGQAVVRREERKVFRLPRSNLRYELLTSDLRGKLVEFLRVELDPGLSDMPELFAHEGEEYGVVIRGTVEVSLDGITHCLRAGDSIFFLATTPHYIRNRGRSTAVMIWAISPPSY